MQYCTDEDSKLLLCDKKTKEWSFAGKIVKAKCVKVYDGDTATFVFVPFPNEEPCKFRCRFLGYDSPEIRQKQPGAIEARDYLTKLILNKIVTLHLSKFDKYGRILVLVIDPNGLNVNQHMVEMGYGKPYFGKGPK